MAKEYDNEHRFALFKNRRKREGKRDADYVGRVTLDGLEYYMNLWRNEAGENAKRPGEVFLSGSISTDPVKQKQPKDYEEKDLDERYPPDESPVRQTQEDFDDDIPF